MENPTKNREYNEIKRRLEAFEKASALKEKKDFFSSIDTTECKGHVVYSHTYEEMDYTYYLEKNFKMKGKYVKSFLSLIYSSDEYSDEYIKMLPVDYVSNLHNDDYYLVSLANYGNFIDTNIYNITKARINRHLFPWGYK